MVSPISHARPDRAAIPTFERSPPPLPSLFPRKRDFVARDFAANTRCCAPLGLLRDRHGLKKPVIVRLDSRDLVWINVTANPTAEWIARQLAEAFPWTLRRATSSAIGIKSMEPSSHTDCEPWAFGTSL
jgi:hypothetical protein